MERLKFLSILRELRNECKRVNEENELLNPDNEVVYEVFQLSDLSENRDNIYMVADFYNKNWQGNRDFMHIPDFEQTLANTRAYPIIIARKKGTDEILGISTIKYDENSEEFIDPYFPEGDAKYFSITGILTKRNNTYKGIGKKIYEIALRGAYNYEKHYPGTRIMCVIDCRNRQSLRALSSAVKNIRDDGFLGNNLYLPANVFGYYELRDKEEGKLLEAPTLVMEVGLSPKEKNGEEEDFGLRNIIFNRKEGQSLFDTLLETLKDNLYEYKINEPQVLEDTDAGMVYFYSLEDREMCKLEGISIESNGTEKGNDRVPKDDIFMRNFMGPIPVIRISEEEVR